MHKNTEKSKREVLKIRKVNIVRKTRKDRAYDRRECACLVLMENSLFPVLLP